MDDRALTTALDRAEQAIERIDHALLARAQAPTPSPRDDALRAKVREAVAELDQLIRMAEA